MSKQYSWSSEIVSGKKRGRNFSLMNCYPDTCVLVDAFLEDSLAPSDKNKIRRINDAKKFFKIYDGHELLTSPMVLAEFIDIATNPNKPFKMSHKDAIMLVEIVS